MQQATNKHIMRVCVVCVCVGGWRYGSRYFDLGLCCFESVFFSLTALWVFEKYWLRLKLHLLFHIVKCFVDGEPVSAVCWRSYSDSNCTVHPLRPERVD